jgi:hypothetical protein
MQGFAKHGRCVVPRHYPCSDADSASRARRRRRTVTPLPARGASLRKCNLSRIYAQPCVAFAPSHPPARAACPQTRARKHVNIAACAAPPAHADLTSIACAATDVPRAAYAHELGAFRATPHLQRPRSRPHDRAELRRRHAAARGRDDAAQSVLCGRAAQRRAALAMRSVRRCDTATKKWRARPNTAVPHATFRCRRAALRATACRGVYPRPLLIGARTGHRVTVRAARAIGREPAPAARAGW